MNQNPRISLRLDGAMRFVASDARGHDVAIDVGAADGGDDSAPSPMEMLLVSLGSCMGMDVIAILRKMRQHVTWYEIAVSGERATEHPQVYTSITMINRVRGPGVVAANVARAIQLSMTRYCPVHAMLRPSVPMTALYEVTDDSTGELSTGTVEPEPNTSRS
jgi:putative redox protein